MQRYHVLCKAVAASILSILGTVVGLDKAMGAANAPGGAGTDLTTITLSADTNRPEMSTFILGETVDITFTVKGLTSATKNLVLNVDVRDEHDRVAGQKQWPLQADAKGQWHTVYAAPRRRLGFYRVTAKLSNGVMLPALGSRPPGFLTYCVVPDPAERRLYPEDETRFGMQGGFSPKVQVLPYLGIRWVLGGYSWSHTEPDHPGQFTEVRAKEREAGKNPPGRTWDWPRVRTDNQEKPWRVYPMPCLFFAPKWAVRPETATYCTGTLTPAGETAWRAYCTAAARAFTEDYPELREHVFQITWEPVYPWGFKGTDENLIRIYKIAYPALHTIDPKAVIIGPTGGGISQTGVRWNLNLLKKGLGRYVDGWSIHPYIALPPERHGLVENIRALKEAIHQYTGRDLPLYGTEQGKPTGEKVSEELPQAQGLLRANLIMLGEGFRFNFAFYITDYSTESGYGYYYNLRKGKPFGTTKVGPKPIAPAYAAQSFLLEGHASAGPIEWLGPTSLGYAFQRGDEVTLALWDYGDHPRAVTLPVGNQKEVEVFDWMGNGRKIAVPTGNLSLTLGPEPVYVRGVSPGVWGRNAQKQLQLTTKHATAEPGGRFTVAGTVLAPPGAPGVDEVRIEPDERLGLKPVTAPASGAPRENVPFSIELTAPPDAEFGRYPVRVVLHRNGQAVAADGLMLHLAPSIAVEAVTPALLPGGVRGVSIALHETQGREVRGRVNVRLRGLPGATQSAGFTLPAGTRRSVALRIPDANPDPARTYPAIVAVKTGRGRRFTQKFRVNLTTGAEVAAAPVVDGRLDEWDATPAISLRGRDHVVRSPEAYDGPHDLSAVPRYAWNATHLFVAVDVTDDVFLQQQTGFGTWRQDCLQLGFNLDPFKQTESTGNLLAEAGAQARYTEIDLAKTSRGPEAYRTITFDKKKLPVGLLPAKDVALAVVRTGDHTVYEAAIPWTALGASAPMTLGNALGVAVAVNDVDDAAQRDPTALGLFGGITPTKNPKRFGVLLLGERRPRDKPRHGPEAPVLVFSGVLGQSQPRDVDPLPFVGTGGAASDTESGLWSAGGTWLYRFRRAPAGDWRLDRKVKSPVAIASALALRSDGTNLYFGGKNRIYVLAPQEAGSMPELCCAPQSKISAFAIAPAGLRKGFAARAKCFVLSGNTVSAFAVDGSPRGPVLELARPAGAKWSFRSIGILPATGDLLVGSYWPDSKVYRFGPDSRQVLDTDWPRKVCAQQIVSVAGRAWAMALGGGTVPLPLTLGNRAAAARGIPPTWTFYCNGLAYNPAWGYWMSTTQGLVHFDASLSPDGKRLGGIESVRSLAIAPDGTVIAAVEHGQRMLRLYLDDAPNAPLECNGNEPFRTGAGWTHHTADMVWQGTTFLVLDETGKQTWNFDPWHTAWGEKPWIQATDPKTLSTPRALTVGDVRFWILDDGHLFEGLTKDPKRLREVKFQRRTELTGVTRIAAADDDALLFLAGPHRVTAFRRAADGSLLQAWQTTAKFAKVADIAAGPGYLAVSDSTAGMIVLLSSRDGKQLAKVSAADVPGGMQPTAIAVRAPWIVAADPNGYRLLRFEVK